MFDPLQYFSWTVYGGVVIAYSALAFHGELSKEDGPLIFSRHNERSLPSVFSIHLIFLMALLALMWASVAIYSHLPNWLTDTFVSRGATFSLLDIMYILAMIVFHYIERGWLYIGSVSLAKE
jgi:hypothetical protein